jgi:hypothetical protein
LSEATRDLLVCREHQYALGRDGSGQAYLSMPGTNGQRQVDYDGYYALTDAELERFLSDPAAALAFATQCRRGDLADRRMARTDPDWEPHG